MLAPEVDIVIVAYASLDLLRACLASLRAHPPAGGANVRVVDNDSRDGTAEMTRAGFPEVELIASNSYLGFAAATNFAIRRGLGPKPRIGDRWWIGDLSEFQHDYPNWGLRYGVEGILREIYEDNVDAWTVAV